MRAIVLAGMVALAGCGGTPDEGFCRYDLRSPPAESGAACQPDADASQPCIGSGDGDTRECWFVCPLGSSPVAASGCTPLAGTCGAVLDPVSNPGPVQECMFACPMANPKCL